MEEDQDWRGDLGWFHTAFHGFICSTIGLHVAMTPNMVHHVCAALQCGSFGLRLACQASLERRSAARVGARLLLFNWILSYRLVLAVKLKLRYALDQVHEFRIRRIGRFNNFIRRSK